MGSPVRAGLTMTMTMAMAMAMATGIATGTVGCSSSDDGGSDENANSETSSETTDTTGSESASETTDTTGSDSSSSDSSGSDSSESASSDTSETTGGEACPDAAAFCDDFESHALGEPPGGAWLPEGSGSAVIDDQQAFGGGQAVHLETTAGWDGRALLGLDDAGLFPTSHFFGRVRMYVTEASPDGVHWTMVQASGMAEAEGVWDGPFMAELRYGGQHQQQLMANYDTPGAYANPPEGPASDCWQHSTTAIPQGRWTCMEWEFDSESDTMRLWFDGAPIDNLELGTMGEGCVNPGTSEAWYYPETFERMQVGWVDYQDFGGERELWIDDVALGFERIGCD